MTSKTTVSQRKVLLLGIGLIALVLGQILLLIILLPEQIPITEETEIFSFPIFNSIILLHHEQRFIVMIGLAGGIGSTVHAATSFTKYLGQNLFYSSWIWWYLLRPFVGAMLSLIMYFAVRGGVLVNGNGLESVSLFGMLTIGSLAGMFSKQAIEKLNQIFNQMFNNSKEKEEDRLDDSETPD